MRELLPARMLNEHVYCPRLFALEWLHALWADNAETIDGKRVHRHVDREDLRQGFDGRTRSLWLSDEELGLTAKIDLLEEEDGEFTPIDFKRGRPAPNEYGVWDPERVQLCAQGLLLRANGLPSQSGAVWFAAARRRVEVPFDDALIDLTLRHREAALELASDPSALPEPLEDSPRCPRCSLVGICLPDEHHHLRRGGGVRPLLPARDDARPLHVQLLGGRLRKDHHELVITDRQGAEVGRAPLPDTSQVVVHGNVSVTTPVLHELARRDIPVSFHGYGGWYLGTFRPASGQNVYLRIAQFAQAADPVAALRLARAFVGGKIRNHRVLLRRNGSGVDHIVLRLRELAEQAVRIPSLEALYGVEGGAARLYFQGFPSMLREGLGFSLAGRNRRPPRDPVNALLSFAYACLARECVVALHRVGFDPFVGFLHQPRHGRPALALDLMEEFRPVIAESAVLTAVNNGELQARHFVTRSTGCSLTPGGRRSFLAVIERRLDEEIVHPVFGTRLGWRRIIEVQARLLAKVLLGEIDEYPAFRVR